MKISKIFPLTLLMIGLSNCGSSGRTIEVTKTSGYQQNHGPFDSNGNYIEKWADNAPKRKYVWSKKTTKYTSSSSSSSKYTPSSRSTSSYKTSKTSKKTYTPAKKSTYTSKKKTTSKNITPKVKPPIMHNVKKGDTLYALSRKYGASVSAIQKINKLKGTNIAIGQKLIIPRK